MALEERPGCVAFGLGHPRGAVKVVLALLDVLPELVLAVPVLERAVVDPGDEVLNRGRLGRLAGAGRGRHATPLGWAVVDVTGLAVTARFSCPSITAVVGSILPLSRSSLVLDALISADVGRVALERSRSRRRGVTGDGPDRKPTVSDEEILAVFKNATDSVLKAGEVAEQLSIGWRAVYDRLRALEEEGLLKSKKTGARSAVWWHPGHTSTEE